MTAKQVTQIRNKEAAELLAQTKSTHQQRVEAFMLGANQGVPDHPCIPSDKVRILRAKLILEEALETLNALGVQLLVAGTNSGPEIPVGGDFQTAVNFPADGTTAFHDFNVVAPCDMKEVADGCCDVKVVTTGTLSAFGMADQLLQEEVDYNNLAKFAEGHTIRADGKLVKPPGHVPPNTKDILLAQGASPEDV